EPDPGCPQNTRGGRPRLRPKKRETRSQKLEKKPETRKERQKKTKAPARLLWFQVFLFSLFQFLVSRFWFRLSRLVGDHEALAVLARQQGVGLLVADELLALHVQFQPAADPAQRLVCRDFVLLEVLAGPLQGGHGLLVVAEGLGRGVEPGVLAQAVADVGQV